MGNSVFAAIAKQKIDIFRATFASSREIFYDKDKNRLRHSGEFGVHREEICADFLKLFLPKYLEIGSGFLMNSFDEVSTQCDLVIFDGSNTPLIEDSRNKRFFPVESVAAIGEVKSKLSKHDFLSALSKLAAAKATRRFENPTHVRRKVDLPDYIHNYDLTVSFLICEKLDFDIKDIVAEISKNYDDKEVPLKHRHNLILSIEDGVFLYKNHLIARDIAWMYPVTHGQRMKNFFISPGVDGYGHFNFFTAYIFMLCANATIFQPDMGQYYPPATESFLQKEN